MSNLSSAKINTLATAIADIHIPTADASAEPRAIGDVLRPFMLELRRSRMTGQPMREEILDRFCAKADASL
jgi:hypothetical protein